MDKTEDDESNESGNHDTDGDAKKESTKTADYQYVKPAGGGKYKIIQKGTGKTLSMHDSKEQAEAAFRAMESHMHGSRTAVATGPNPYGSKVYNPQDAIDQGYKEGYRYAVLWTPGKPVPSALTSSAAVGHQYNAEYVQGYKEGTAAAVGQMDQATKAAWAKAATAVQMVARRQAASGGAECTKSDGKTPCNFKEGQGAHCSAHGGSLKTAALPQLELSAMDQTPSNPGEFGADAPTVDGKGASDVASVPTPGQSTADYPAPGGSQTPAIGEDPADAWVGQEAGAADSNKAAAFRATVQANLRRGR